LGGFLCLSCDGIAPDTSQLQDQETEGNNGQDKHAVLILMVAESFHLHSFFSCHLLANIIEYELQHVSSIDCSLLPRSLFASSIPLLMVLYIFLNGLYSRKGNEEKQDSFEAGSLTTTGSIASMNGTWSWLL
jgi:hypothetical protein